MAIDLAVLGYVIPEEKIENFVRMLLCANRRGGILVSAKRKFLVRLTLRLRV